MTEPKESPGKKAIRYAEDQLGVHQVYEAAGTARQALDETLGLLSEARDKRRNFEETLAEAEANVVIAERSTHPDMSQAQMDKHVKAAIHKDSACQGIRAALSEIAGDIDGLEMDRDMAETDIKIAVARMNQLAGYFQYLAAVKQAQSGGISAPAVKPGPWDS